ncbi:lipid-A-disaccharide synthase [Cyclobacterium qasimii]|uniref:Lipid-A-disaccharide synthase n=2 Tax=Cyclobacterium qasimii TaxID=1350429 RepID=S7V743_9BACT|nr:lipid-A-disaccharide synthase [Cyclobacterium qasimii]EPR65711.1 Lipid-A-disaccharide synthase [Cyclobacterium qasimii M12-11B]GEO23668.1 lipid-A-disaccharide synthase [Cyclobacterium qasimii]
MKYYIIAGERSGDLHASNLLLALKKKDPDAEFRGMGGEYMEEAGCTLFAHYKEMALMGFVEVLMHFRRVFRYLSAVKKDILDFQPDALILVDFAGFNMKIATFATKKGIKVHYYIAPKVWAWNQNRAYKLKKNVDKLYAILPFETDFFKKFDWQVDYVGNPLLDEIKKFKPEHDFLSQYQLEGKPLIALLPGSRKQEVDKMLTTMIALKSNFQGVNWVIAGVRNLPPEVYEAAEKAGIQVVYDKTYDILLHARAAVVTSGTATLETALFNIPQVVVYKTSKISYAIGMQLIKVAYASLVNIIVDREVVKELIQGEYVSESVETELRGIFEDGPKREKVLEGYGELRGLLGNKKASQETARLIIESLSG